MSFSTGHRAGVNKSIQPPQYQHIFKDLTDWPCHCSCKKIALAYWRGNTKWKHMLHKCREQRLSRLVLLIALNRKPIWWVPACQCNNAMGSTSGFVCRDKINKIQLAKRFGCIRACLPSTCNSRQMSAEINQIQTKINTPFSAQY